MSSQTPPDVRETSSMLTSSRTSINDGTKQKYNKVYAEYKAFCAEKKAHIGQSSVQAFFYEMEQRKQFKPTTIKQRISALRSSIGAYDSVDINWRPVFKWIEGLLQHHGAKQAPAFETAEVQNFIENADEDQYFIAKQVIIISILMGARVSEIYQFRWDGFVVRDGGDVLVLKRQGMSKTDKAGDGAEHVLSRKETPSWLDPLVCQQPLVFELDRIGAQMPNHSRGTKNSLICGKSEVASTTMLTSCRFATAK